MEIKVLEDGIRLDKFLASSTEYSREYITKMLDNGYILVNNIKVKASYKVKKDDVIIIDETFKENTDIIPTKMDLDIIYEDEDIIVINKPSGLTVHPGSGNYSNTLVNGLMYYTKNLSDIGGEERPGIVHRIDKDTSGLLLVAKNNKAHNILSEDFKDKKVKRKYIALVNGIFPHNTATVDAPIGRDKLNRQRMAVTEENSKQAVTHLKVIKRYKKYTLLSLMLETGRTHQIRVHMEYIGYPIYNDPVYSKNQATSFGQFLHSAEMDLIHPISKKEMHFEAPLPDVFKDFISDLDEEIE